MPYQSPAIILGWVAILGLFAPSQPFAIQQTDLPQDLLKDSRAMIHVKLQRLLLSRFMQPMDEWIRLGTPQAMFAHTNVQEAWYAIVITSQNGKTLALRFCLDRQRKKLRHSWTVQDEEMGFDYDESNSEYMLRRREEILVALEKYAVDEMGDPGAAETLRTGEAHLYRLAAMDADLTVLRKEDLIY